MLDIIRKRYAVKNFSGEKIPEEDILKLKEAIKLSPSSFNWQPWKIKIVDDKETLEKLKKLSYNQPQVSNASHLFVFCALDSLEENNEKLIKLMKEKIPKEKAEGYEKIVNGALSQMSKDNQARMSERELFLAVENLLLVATDLGYAACPMGEFIHEKYSEMLKIPSNLKPIVIVPVGIPTDEAREKIRFSDEEIFF